MIDFADRGKPLPVDRGLPGSHLGGIAPDVTEFLQWNFIAGDVSVEQGLIAAAGKFDDDVLYGFLKFGVADQSHVEVAGSLDPMDFSDDHDAMLLECRDDALDGVNHITA